VVGPGSRIQMVAGAGSAWTFAPDHTALGRVRLARTEDVSDAFTVARHLEATVGWAYRPVASDKVAVLSRYSFLADMRPVNTSFEQWQREDASWIDHRSHVLAVVPLAELPGGVTLGGKLALKHTYGSNHLTSGDAVDARVTALLGLARVGYRLYGRWDASGELRRLSLHRDGGGEALWGSLFELGYGVAAWVRLGFGYNFSHFSDDELGDLERDSHGLFIRITGHY
jgi:hypothetical protein